MTDLVTGMALVWGIDFNEPTSPMELMDLLSQIAGEITHDQTDRTQLRAERDQLQHVIADIYAAVTIPVALDPTEVTIKVVEFTEVPARVRQVVSKRNRLQAVLRRALQELSVPPSYGPGTVWNEMLELDSEEQP